MDMNRWMADWMAAPVKKTMPVLSFPCVSLLGVTVRELLSDPRLQAEGLTRVAARVDSAASVSMMDLSVEAEAFGAKVRFSDTEVPTIIGSLVTTQEEAEALPVPPIGTGRTGRNLEAMAEAKRRITDRPVFAGVIGPFSLAGRLMGVSEALENCYEAPEMVETLMDKATDFLIDYIRAYREAGLDGVVLAEPLTGLLSPRLADKFSHPWVKRLTQAVQTPEFALIYHNCGNYTVQMIASILGIGAAAYHFGNAISMADMLPHVPTDVPVMGNIDPAGVLCNGTPEQVRAAVLSLMEALCPQYPNFLISSGCDIPPKTPWANIDAYFTAVADYYREHERH